MADSSSSGPQGGLSLPALFSRGLASASKAYNLSSLDDETQTLLQSSIQDLRNVSKRVQALSLFSDNETLEDVATKDLVYMFVPYALAEVIGRVRTTGNQERLTNLREAQTYLTRFLKLLDDYEVVPEEERKLFDKSGKGPQDPAKRRENKIAQYKKEKELRAKIAALAARRGHQPSDSSTDFDLIASLLPSQGQDQDDEDSTDEDVVREVTTVLLRLIRTRAISQLDSMAMEMELLRNAPAEPSSGQTPQQDEDSTWRLDRVTTGGPDGKGPLLDANGRPLRMFQILPSGPMAERARLQAQVFQPDHRLPSMTIDEYLEEERRRGNIISGGGAASQNAPTTSEQLAIDSEQDGTIFGEEKQEEKRRKDEEWARFADANAKGSGNTMNRG